MKINKDTVFNNLVATTILKVPRYEFLVDIGDEYGMLGDIVVETSTQTFYGHNGITWVPFSGGGGITTLSSAGGFSLVSDGIGPTLEVYGLSTDGSVTITPTPTTLQLSVASVPGQSLWTLANINDYVQNVLVPGVTFGGNNLTFGANGTESTEVASPIRFFFIGDAADPSYGSLRAGSASGTEWDVANRGLDSVAFGTNNRAAAVTSSILGGSSQDIDADCTASGIVAGASNSIRNTSLTCGIVSGELNLIQTQNNMCGILSGVSNQIIGTINSSISSGNSNQINLAGQSFIGSGNLNLISSSSNTFIGAGANNQVGSNSDNSSIVSGVNGQISNTSIRSSILTGNANVLEDATDCSILSGRINAIRTSQRSSIMASDNCTIAGVNDASIISLTNRTNNNEPDTLWTNNLRTFGGRRKLVRVILPATPNPFIPSSNDHIIYIDTVGFNARTIQLPLNPIEGTEYYIRLDAKNPAHVTTVQATAPNVINWTGPQGTIPQPALASFTMGAIAGASGSFTAHIVFTSVIPGGEWILLDLH